LNRKAIGQALHCAKETAGKPTVAFFILHQQPGDREKLKFVTRLCRCYKIKVWFMNDEPENRCKNQLKEFHVTI